MFRFMARKRKEEDNMIKLGIDIGSSTIRAAVLEDGKIKNTACKGHRGQIVRALVSLLEDMALPIEALLCLSGANSEAVLRICPEAEIAEEIPAIAEGVKLLQPNAGCVIEIGSQNSRFITGLGDAVPRFSKNEHCAGGTGSFFEAQMARLGMNIEDYSGLLEQAKNIPNLSGRCAVFAKTDVIHRQQEGVPKQDILLGLCYAMMRNYKATIVRNLPIEKPVAFCGGVTKNTGVIRAIKDVFKLSDDELIISEYAPYAAAIGTAEKAKTAVNIKEFIARLKTAGDTAGSSHAWKSLQKLCENADAAAQPGENKDPVCTGIIPDGGVSLGIDVGSTSTDLVLAGSKGELVDFLYLRTAGDPEGAVRKGLAAIRKKYGDIGFKGVGITGSGRERLGRMMGADCVRDEITAQARAAVYFSPQADTVFEIGGQDSKYISLKDGRVTDFQMNRICAAGTGAFVEEQAEGMGISIDDFGPMALRAENPCELGERCTVFIETAIVQAESMGATKEDIAAGVCSSVVANYLHKVVGNKPVGTNIVLQGGVAYNPGIVAAFRREYGSRIKVSPVFSISGAYGAALLAREEVGEKPSTFCGFDFPDKDIKTQISDKEEKKNRAFYKKAGELILADYDRRINTKKKTIGVPLSLIVFKFFPMINAFFRNLGFNVLLSEASGEKTIRLAQQYAQGETCYPVKLMYGHMMQLAEKKVDYIFMPSIRTIKHPHAGAAHNYACPYMQQAAKAVYETLGLKERGIKLLSPVFDLDLGAQMMALAMLETGKELGFARPRCLPGLAKGALAIRRNTANVEKLGKKLLDSLKPDDKVMVIITRNYGISDPVLNMGIPEILLSHGCKVITLTHLPGMSLDISEDYPNMYWPFGDHILSGAKLIANHPNLYAVYLTNHGCGPDTLISHMFKEVMGEKPYLQIEVDEHYSRVGVVTRIEAFLNSIKSRPGVALPPNFDIRNVEKRKTNISAKPMADKRLFVPDFGYYTRYIVDYFKRQGVDAEAMPSVTDKTLALGKAEMNSKEYLPLTMLVGGCKEVISGLGGDAGIQFLIPYNYGADSDGQYARAVCTILDRNGFKNYTVVAPILEELPEKAFDMELLKRALRTGDAVYMLPADKREELAPSSIPNEAELDELYALSEEYKKEYNGRVIAATGDILCITTLGRSILEELERKGTKIERMPLYEYFMFLWHDNGKIPDGAGLEKLVHTADACLGSYAGNNGRYRYAKTVEQGRRTDAVLALVPRYENTAMVLKLRGIDAVCSAPFFEIPLDGDENMGGASALQSFLYYCK